MELWSQNHKWRAAPLFGLGLEMGLGLGLGLAPFLLYTLAKDSR